MESNWLGTYSYLIPFAIAFESVYRQPCNHAAVAMANYCNIYSCYFSGAGRIITGILLIWHSSGTGHVIKKRLVFESVNTNIEVGSGHCV